MSAQVWSFFMGANTKDGFYSLFDHIKTEEEGRRVYAIKSGPGCGKSTCMGKLAHALAKPTEAWESIRCSSDPDSLDGIILDGSRLAVVDGTAPHVYDPSLPGAEGGYIAFPPFINLDELEEKAPLLKQLKERGRGHYSSAYHLIHGSWRIDETIAAMIVPYTDFDALHRRSGGIITREIPKTFGKGKLRLRFLDGITPDGILRLDATVGAMADKVYELSDSYGLSHTMLEPIRDAALARGHTVYACMCPQNPSRLRHVLIPGLGLAFVTTRTDDPYPTKPFRRIRVDAYQNTQAFRTNRGRIRLLAKISASLMEDAVAELSAARNLHQRVEELYRPHIDIAALEQVTQEAIDRLGR